MTPADTSTLAEIEARQWEVITQLEKGQERTVAIMDAMVTRLEGIEKKLGDVAKPQWQAISIMMGVVFFVYGIISFGINAKIDGFGRVAEQTRTTLAEHMSNGHPASVIESIKANKEAIETQIEANRREADQLGARMQRLEQKEDERWLPQR